MHSPGPRRTYEQNFGGWTIEDAQGVGFAGANSEADARLIAAAPELLLLLRDLVERFPALPLVHERELIARIEG